jgi:membrane-associated phospholipid phosphatase
MEIPRRARTAFIGAGLGLAALALTWYAAHEIAWLRRVDVNILLGFLQLNRPKVDGIADSFVWLCDPRHYVVLAAIPVVIALVRGRRRLAVTALMLLVGANITTEVLKPLTAGPRDAVNVPGVVLSHATWPSGHTTAAMSLALAFIICVPGRLRPVVSGVMALFVVGVVYSLLTLGAHYPSDIVGGLGVAVTWTLFALGTLWTFEAHRPALAARLSSARAPAASSVAQVLWPPVVALLTAVAIVLLALSRRPHAAIGFAGSHAAFMTAALALVVLSFGCAIGVSLLLRRPPGTAPGNGPAPTEARRRRPGHSLPG